MGGVLPDMNIKKTLTIAKTTRVSVVGFALMLFFSSKKQGKGFTLLELMIVIIFAGIFAAIAIPSFIKQVGKARESEVKNAVGSVNRAQQAYHWEKATFAQGVDDLASLQLLNISISNRYIDSFSITGNSTIATIAPANLNFVLDQTKAYAGGTFYNTGLYEILICGSSDPVASISPPTNPNDCGTNQIIQ